MACCFSVNKEASLQIIRSIIASGKLYNPELAEDDEYQYLYQHKLMVANVRLDEDLPEDARIDQYYDEIIVECNGEIQHELWSMGGVSRSDKICLKEITITERDTITTEGHYFNTHMECDWTWPTFAYDERLQSWIIKDESSPHGICHRADGVITILDFSNYFVCST